MPAISVHHTAVDPTAAWDGPAEEAKLNTPITSAVAKGMYAWYDPKGSDDDGDGWPDVKSAYKFPHHFVTDGKPGKASLRGVNNAMSRLEDADIPESDKAGVRKHLQAHQDDAKKAQNRIHAPIRCFDGNAQPHEAFWQVVDSAQSQSGEPEIELYGAISEFSWLDDDITPKMFRDALWSAGHGGPVTMRINSPGGDVIAASMMRSMMADYPGDITARIDGMCASAATIVAMGAKSVRIVDSATMMIHDPSMLFFLADINIETMQRIVDQLQSIKDNIVSVYADRTGIGEDRISRMMTNQTVLSAKDAVKFGFADEIMPGGQAKKKKKNPDEMEPDKMDPGEGMEPDENEPMPMMQSSKLTTLGIQSSDAHVSDVNDADAKSARLKREAQSLRAFAQKYL